MTRKLLRFVKPTAVVVFVMYVGFSLVVYTWPEWFFYHPVAAKPDIARATSLLNDVQEVSYQTPAGKTGYAWYARPKNARKAMIFFHGNAYHIGYFLKRVKPFYDAGFAVLMPEYTGFGGLEGVPNQKDLEQDALGAAHFLKAKGFKNKDIVLYGYSLGTYMAVHTAARATDTENMTDPYNAVILEAPFTSIADVADEVSFRLFPVSVLVKDKYDSKSQIDKISTRLFVAHGTRDKTVPFHQGRELYEQAVGNKMFFAVEGATHRNLPEHGFFDAVLRWLKDE